MLLLLFYLIVTILWRYRVICFFLAGVFRERETFNTVFLFELLNLCILDDPVVKVPIGEYNIINDSVVEQEAPMGDKIAWQIIAWLILARQGVASDDPRHPNPESKIIQNP